MPGTHRENILDQIKKISHSNGTSSVARISVPILLKPDLFQELGEQSIGVPVLDNPMLSTDGNKAQTKLMLDIFGSFAEYERDLILERTEGRPKLLDGPKVDQVNALHTAGVMSGSSESGGFRRKLHPGF